MLTAIQRTVNKARNKFIGWIPPSQGLYCTPSWCMSHRAKVFFFFSFSFSSRVALRWIYNEMQEGSRRRRSVVGHSLRVCVCVMLYFLVWIDYRWFLMLLFAFVTGPGWRKWIDDDGTAPSIRSGCRQTATSRTAHRQLPILHGQSWRWLSLHVLTI